jgi:hypothetical protein
MQMTLLINEKVFRDDRINDIANHQKPGAVPIHGMNVVSSDVDLELQLLHEIVKWETKQVKISISFVRSHQELKKLKLELSHVETFNFLADSLVKEARKYPRVSQYISVPQNPVDFKINNTTINAKYALRSTKAFHSIAFWQYLQNKHHWSHSTIESIW